MEREYLERLARQGGDIGTRAAELLKYSDDQPRGADGRWEAISDALGALLPDDEQRGPATVTQDLLETARNHIEAGRLSEAKEAVDEAYRRISDTPLVDSIGEIKSDMEDAMGVSKSVDPELLAYLEKQSIMGGHGAVVAQEQLMRLAGEVHKYDPDQPRDADGRVTPTAANAGSRR